MISEDVTKTGKHMKKDFKYSGEDYTELLEALSGCERICRPDEFQYYHNELSKVIAYFLLKPYYDQLEHENHEKQD